MFRIGLICKGECILKTVTTRVPEEEKELIEKIGEEEGAAQSEILRRMIKESLDQWKRQKALSLLSEGEASIRKAAEIAGISYVEMLDLASDEGIETGYSEEDLEKDLERI